MSQTVLPALKTALTDTFVTTKQILISKQTKHLTIPELCQKSKRKHLKGEGKSSKKNKAEPIDETETQMIYEKQVLGASKFQF